MATNSSKLIAMLLLLCFTQFVVSTTTTRQEEEQDQERRRSTLLMTLREQKAVLHGQGVGMDRWVVQETTTEWPIDQTAFIIIDMWNDHWCAAEVVRTMPIALHINTTITHLRNRGMLILHAPSDVVNFYAAYQARQWVARLPKAPQPPIRPHVDPDYPLIVGKDDGCDSGQQPSAATWTRQSPLITIDDGRDGISAESGWWPQHSQEMWNIFASRNISYVLVAGVASNMCVLGRPFGIKALVTWGVRVALVRELTDPMFNSITAAPYVEHDIAKQLQVEFIEKFWCPTVSVEDLIL